MQTDIQREQYESAQSQRALSSPEPAKDLLEYLKNYAREKPEIAALTCFTVGFLLGWKLKPW